MYEKLKSLVINDSLFTVVVIILVAIVSFALGRLSVLDIQTQVPQSGVIFKTTELRTLEINPKTNNRALVASQSGTRYHLLDCPGAKQIKDENKVYFLSADEARSAGYLPAANCPELD
jgi:hypothetical protein